MLTYWTFLYLDPTNFRSTPVARITQKEGHTAKRQLVQQGLEDMLASIRPTLAIGSPETCRNFARPTHFSRNSSQNHTKPRGGRRQYVSPVPPRLVGLVLKTCDNRRDNSKGLWAEPSIFIYSNRTRTPSFYPAGPARKP